MIDRVDLKEAALGRARVNVDWYSAVMVPADGRSTMSWGRRARRVR